MPAPRPPAEREWASFCSAYDRIKGLDDLPGYPAWLQEVKGLLWRWWSEVCFVFTASAAAGSTDGGAVASLSLQEFSTLCKQCRLLAVPLRVEDRPPLHHDRPHGDDVENGNPRARSSYTVHGSPPPHRRHPTRARARGAFLSLPAALEQLLHRHILHYCGALGSAQNVRFTLEGPRCAATSCVTMPNFAAVWRAAAATPGQLSIGGWLSLMGATELKLRDGAVRAFRKGELIEAFQAAQLFGDDNRDAHHCQLDPRLVYPEFVEALGRLALNGAPEAAAPAGAATATAAVVAAAAVGRRVGDFIMAFAAHRQPGDERSSTAAPKRKESTVAEIARERLAAVAPRRRRARRPQGSTAGGPLAAGASRSSGGRRRRGTTRRSRRAGARGARRGRRPPIARRCRRARVRAAVRRSAPTAGARRSRRPTASPTTSCDASRARRGRAGFRASLHATVGPDGVY